MIAQKQDICGSIGESMSSNIWKTFEHIYRKTSKQEQEQNIKQ